jgi:hypothetical protein
MACLPLVPRFASSNPAEYDELLRAITIGNMSFFGEELKPSAQCRKILRHVKDPCVV